MTKIRRFGRFEKSCLRWTSEGPDRAGSIRKTKLPSDLDPFRVAELFPQGFRCFPRPFDIQALRLSAD
jgi:hypothetical protein